MLLNKKLIVYQNMFRKYASVDPSADALIVKAAAATMSCDSHNRDVHAIIERDDACR